MVNGQGKCTIVSNCRACYYFHHRSPRYHQICSTHKKNTKFQTNLMENHPQWRAPYPLNLILHEEQRRYMQYKLHMLHVLNRSTAEALFTGLHPNMMGHLGINCPQSPILRRSRETVSGSKLWNLLYISSGDPERQWVAASYETCYLQEIRETASGSKLWNLLSSGDQRDSEWQQAMKLAIFRRSRETVSGSKLWNLPSSGDPERQWVAASYETCYLQEIQRDSEWQQAMKLAISSGDPERQWVAASYETCHPQELQRNSEWQQAENEASYTAITISILFRSQSTWHQDELEATKIQVKFCKSKNLDPDCTIKNLHKR